MSISKINFICLIICVILNVSLIKAQKVDSNSLLWYQQPANEWMKAIPMGNGRIGAMIYGGTDTEKIALNEVTMWSGQHDDNQEIPCGKEKLAEIRQLFFDGKLVEGNKMATEFLAGRPNSFGTNLPVGNLIFKFNDSTFPVSEYIRELNLKNSITTVSYKQKNIKFKREYFCSNPDDALVVRLSADAKSAINMNISLDLLRKAQISTSNNEIEFSGKVAFDKFGPGGVNFLGKVRVVVKGGSIQKNMDNLNVINADEVLVFFDVKTDFVSKNYKERCANTIAQIASKTYEKIKQDHIKDYKKLFDRVDLSFEENSNNNYPTDLRWKNLKGGKEDVGLDVLFFNYGRYLLISGSRENSPLPLNLQGIWNDNIACNMPWTCDYHLDMNTQQNYWSSNVTNLKECNVPLFNYIEKLSNEGEQTAMKAYGARGWVAHTVANVWGFTASGSGVNWGLFPMAGAWIASHLWTEYSYTQDSVFLRSKAYPILKKAALFLKDYMVVNPNNGYLMTGPSTSPENSFGYKGADLSLSMMPTCDRELVYETYTSCIEASKILNVDREFRKLLEEDLKKLPPVKIGKDGTIQEWFEDYDQLHPNHRHTSHLLALYPYNQISLVNTPDLAMAADRTIYNRQHAEGWEDVEWSRANMINFFARLKKGDQAYENLSMLLKGATRENLFTMSAKGIAGAPCDIFSFDANEAGIAGIAEMLLQSHEGYIEFLPALPMQWYSGQFKGLCVRGGAEVDLIWKKGNVKYAAIKATCNNTFKIKLATKEKPQCTINGKKHIIEVDNKGIISLKLQKTEIAVLKY